jgi:hypothetical protein
MTVMINGVQCGRSHAYSDNVAMALTTSFKEVALGFLSVGINLANRQSGGTISYSFDGTTVHGVLKDTDTQPRTFLFKSTRSVWLKGAAGGEAYHLDAWGD